MPITSRFASAAARAYGMFRIAAGAVVDPFFNYVTALLHGDGTNGAQNNTFLDSSTNNFTITRNGNTTQGTFSPFSQTGWSNYFDGSGDYLTAANSAAFALPADFTVEAWVYFNSNTTSVFCGNIDSSGYGDWAFFYNNAVGLRWLTDNNTTVLTAAYTMPLNTWTHVAISRSGTNVRFFANGALLTTVTNSSSNTFAGTMFIGSSNNGGLQFPGYMSNLRIVKGTAVYTAAFTPPTVPLTAISGTSLLTCQANRFLDASSNNFAITKTGDVSVQAFSPFNPTSAWSASSNGGSGYFDGSGDYLSIANNAAFNLGTNSFCIDGWFYPTTTNATQLVFNKWGTVSDVQSMFQIGRISSNFYAQLRTTSGYVTLSTATWIPNAWNHFAVVRSGSTISAYLNGSRFGTDTSNPTLNSGTDTMTIGSKQAQDYFTGYISDCRIVNGSAIYDPTQTSITVPTAPTTAVTNTAFLSSNTNAGIYDNAAVGDYETVGNAQVSTSVVKYGTGSMAFDGTGDWLSSPNQQGFNLGSGDFTIECWVYANNLSNLYGIFGKRVDTGVETKWVCSYINTNGTIQTQLSTSGAAWLFNTATTTAITSGTWNHIAWVRLGSNFYVYVNGLRNTITTTLSGSVYTDSSALILGATGTTGAYILSMNGYIDDLRITKGVGRYPYNFTPPTAAFPNIGGTITLTADPYFNYTTLLLPGNGTNGAQNNTFLDSSSNAFTITRNGNTTQGNFSPFSQTGWGNYFDGATATRLTLPSNAAFAFGTGAYTVEAWVYLTAYGTQTTIFGAGSASGAFDFAVLSSGALSIGTYGVGAVLSSSASAVPLNQWVYVAAVRTSTSANGTALFVNGTSVATGTDASNWTVTTTPNIGGYNLAGYTLTGYISNLRITKGGALYSANFTPSTTPLTTTVSAGTVSLLTCQSNRFVDNSANAFAITVNGSPSIQAFSPFAPTAAWTASTNGGSGYFDGSGDYLRYATNTSSAFSLGTNNFTCEAWVYPTAFSSANIIACQNQTNGSAGLAFALYLNASGQPILLAAASTGVYAVNITGTAISLNTWTHLAVTRNGSTFTIWKNGVSDATATSTVTITQDTTAGYGGWTVGASTITAQNFTGYIADHRLVNGTAVYTGAFTPPTAPLTAISGTSLLLSATNGGIVDATAKNDLETVGNAQISTTQSKFGGSSMLFNGTTDYLTRPGSTLLDFGTSDFTIEAWVYPSATQTQFANIVCQASTGNSWYLSFGTSNAVTFSTYAAVLLTSSVGLSNSTWTHVAVTRYGTSLKMFFNGIQVASATDSTSLGITAKLNVGFNGSLYYFNGYIDDLRITKGIARYTSNFTPPTSAFLLQ